MLIQRLLLGPLCVAVTQYQADSGVAWKELLGYAFSDLGGHPVIPSCLLTRPVCLPSLEPWM